MTMRTNAKSFLFVPSKVLTLCGVWPVEKTSLFSVIYRSIMLSSQFCFLVFNGIYIGLMWGDLKAVSDALYMFFTQSTCCSKAIGFYFNFLKIKRIVASMDDVLFTAMSIEDQATIFSHSRTVNKLYKGVLGFTGFTLVQWTVLSLIGSERTLPFNEMWVPTDISKSPNYEITFVVELWMMVISAALFMSVDTITVATMMFSCAQLDIIMKKTQQIQEIPLSPDLSSRNRSELHEKNNGILVDCIKHHQAIVRFSELCEGTFQVHSFFHLGGIVFMICVIGFRMAGQRLFHEQESPVSAQFWAALSYLVIILGQLYLYCWCANELTTKSEQLRDKLYLTPWYDQDMKFKRNLCIAMECMAKSLTFRAGSYIPLSRAMFVSILRSSYSYFAFLNQANEQ
ncbi:odorant receptor 43a-like isoform X1 [Bombyx mandarina]|uniref:Odorant receptor n=2 Tax=Bombyx TaxID=7090 RepID=A0A6J2K9B5_BOMMA|nr:odorant receptor 43a-like isoform X1 [Bombyx mandarina]